MDIFAAETSDSGARQSNDDEILMIVTLLISLLFTIFLTAELVVPYGSMMMKNFYSDGDDYSYYEEESEFLDNYSSSEESTE